MANFRDSEQRARVGRALLSVIRKDHLWSLAGPTEQAFNHLEKKTLALSTGEDVLWRLAWLTWEMPGDDMDLSVLEVITSLDHEHLRQVAELLLAMAGGPGVVDAWLAKYEHE